MTRSLHLFSKASTSSSGSPYENVGFSINPFRPTEADIRSGNVPFFDEYIAAQLVQISQWVDDVHVNEQRHPIALVGNIGVGKTLIIGRLVHLLRERVDEKIAVDSLILSDAGYGRISVGSWLVMALERLNFPWLPTPEPLPPDVLPVLYHLAQQPSVTGPGRIARALEHIRMQSDAERTNLVRHLTTWIKRGAITDAQSRKLGLGRRLDWEGELIPVVGEILMMARQTDILGTFFLFIDQLEDLFSKGLTAVRRSRVLTDLRALIDIIDGGAPIGLLLSWAPSFDAEIRVQYPAVYTRLARRRVDLPLLELKHAPGFTKAWMVGQKKGAGYNPSKQPSSDDLSMSAWDSLRRKKLLFPPGEKATPRDFLAALADEIDRRAGLS
jgi:hypothetical protein